MGIMRRFRARMSTWSKSSRIKPQRIAAAVCFACACALVVWILTPDQGGTSVVVANRNLPPGSELRTQDLTVVEFPTQLVPDKVFTAVSDAEHKRTSA